MQRKKTKSFGSKCKYIVRFVWISKVVVCLVCPTQKPPIR